MLANSVFLSKAKDPKTRTVAIITQAMLDLRPRVSVSPDVIKKCMALVGRVKAVDHLDGYRALEPTLFSLKLLNPTFRYKLQTGVFDTLLRVSIVMPHAVESFPYHFKVIGIDGAHCKLIELKTSPRTLLKQNTLTMITSRTANNEMSILAFTVTYSENSLDIIDLLQDCLDAGLPFNAADISVITDR